MNHLSISGRLANSPDLNYTKKGIAALNFTIIDNVETTEGSAPISFKCVLFGVRANAMKEQVEKGSKVHLNGVLHPNNYTTDSGEKRYEKKLVVDWIDWADSINKGQSSE